jgi:hypothetical protein
MTVPCHNRRVRCRLALALLAACGSAATPAVQTVESPPRPEAEVRPAVVPARTDLATPTPPTSLVALGGALFWSDAFGAIWTMRADGSTPARQLSDGQKPGFAFHLFRAGERVFATSRKDLLRVDADGSVHAMSLKLAELPEESVGDAGSLYITLFKRTEVLKIGATDRSRTTLATVPRGVLGIHGDTLYIASYSTGALVAVPTRGGAARTITTGLPRPTAVAADDEAVYVYCERDRTVRRVELAGGATTVIARGLENSDELLSDGPLLWTISWGPEPGLVHVSKDGSRPAARLTRDLRRPTKLTVDDHAIYVSSRDEPRIVRIPRGLVPDR